MQSHLIFKNLATLLQEADMKPEHIVHLRTFVTAREHFPEYMEVRDAFLEGVDIKPVSPKVHCGLRCRPERQEKNCKLLDMRIRSWYRPPR